MDATQWIPYSDENVVIVDDLDPGFEVHGGYSPSKTPSWVLGGELFRSMYPQREELDNGLPSATYLLTHSGNWARSSWGAGWGRYRHTYVFAPTSIRPIIGVIQC